MILSIEKEKAGSSATSSTTSSDSIVADFFSSFDVAKAVFSSTDSDSADSISAPDSAATGVISDTGSAKGK